MRCDLLHLFFQPLGRLVDRRATYCRRAAPICATAFGSRIGISMDDHYIFNRNTVLLSNDLSERRLFPLAMRRRTCVYHNGATLLDSHTRALIEADRSRTFRAKAADLDVGREANTHQLAVASSTPAGLFRAQVLIVRYLKRFVQRPLVVTCVIDCPGSRLVGELIWFDEVESAHLSRVFPQLARHEVNSALGNIRRFWAACSSICISGNFVGKDDVTTEVNIWNIVSAAGYRESESDHNHISEELRIGAQIGDAVYLQAGDLALFRSCNLDIVNLVAPVDGRRQILAAVFNPFDRLPCLHRSVCGADFFGVNIQLAAKATANFGYNHAHLVLRKTNGSGQNVA